MRGTTRGSLRRWTAWSAMSSVPGSNRNPPIQTGRCASDCRRSGYVGPNMQTRVAVATQFIVFPWFGLHSSLGDNLAIGAIFVGISLLRSYALLRMFEAISGR